MSLEDALKYNNLPVGTYYFVQDSYNYWYRFKQLRAVKSFLIKEMLTEDSVKMITIKPSC